MLRRRRSVVCPRSGNHSISACSDSVVFAIGVPISNDELTSLRSSDLRSGGIVLDDLFARAHRSGIHCRFTTKSWKTVSVPHCKRKDGDWEGMRTRGGRQETSPARPGFVVFEERTNQCSNMLRLGRVWRQWAARRGLSSSKARRIMLGHWARKLLVSCSKFGA